MVNIIQKLCSPRLLFLLLLLSSLLLVFFFLFKLHFFFKVRDLIFFVINKISMLFSNLCNYDRRYRCCFIMYSFFILYLLSNILLYRVPHQLYNIQVKRNIIIIVLRKNMEVKEYVKHVKVSLVNLAKLNRLSDLPNKYVPFCILNH